MSEKISRDSVLVIDDNPDFCELIETIGQLYGVRVLTAPDCGKGLKVLTREQARIKLILLDYFMPGMEPAPCARMITAKAGPLVPVVLVTAATNPSVRAAELHLSRWISKPVDPGILMGVMTQTTPIGRHH
jgi:CheY-like chemotaxis protein